MSEAKCYCPSQDKSHCPTTSEITPTRCWVSYSNGFCFRNMMPCSFDYLIYPYYPAYTMGCYQIVINGDNGRQSILLFLCWFTTLIIAQKAGKCNCILRLFQSVHHPNKLESGLFIFFLLFSTTAKMHSPINMMNIAE